MRFLEGFAAADFAWTALANDAGASKGEEARAALGGAATAAGRLTCRGIGMPLPAGAGFAPGCAGRAAGASAFAGAVWILICGDLRAGRGCDPGGGADLLWPSPSNARAKSSLFCCDIRKLRHDRPIFAAFSQESTKSIVAGAFAIAVVSSRAL
jgi:hypothetical protein